MRMVAIAEDHQGRGHGRALLRHAEAFARANGAHRATVNAAPDATGFYERAGYAEWGEAEGAEGEAVRMGKDF